MIKEYVIKVDDNFVTNCGNNYYYSPSLDSYIRKDDLLNVSELTEQYIKNKFPNLKSDELDVGDVIEISGCYGVVTMIQHYADCGIGYYTLWSDGSCGIKYSDDIAWGAKRIGHISDINNLLDEIRAYRKKS